MPETAGQIILDALKELVVLPAESAIPAYEAQVGIFYLNAMMGDLSVTGINLGYTYVDSLADEITVDDGALDGMVKNLAIEMSPVFKEQPTSNDLFLQAQSGLDVMRQISFDGIAPAPYSNNLPVGSGNEYDRIDNFYDTLRNPILTELGGNIGIEDVS